MFTRCSLEAVCSAIPNFLTWKLTFSPFPLTFMSVLLAMYAWTWKTEWHRVGCQLILVQWMNNTEKIDSNLNVKKKKITYLPSIENRAATPWWKQTCHAWDPTVFLNGGEKLREVTEPPDEAREWLNFSVEWEECSWDRVDSKSYASTVLVLVPNFGISPNPVSSRLSRAKGSWLTEACFVQTVLVDSFIKC